MDNAERVALASEDMGHPQLLDDPLLPIPQESLSALDADETSHVVSDMRGHVFARPQAVAEL